MRSGEHRGHVPVGGIEQISDRVWPEARFRGTGSFGGVDAHEAPSADDAFARRGAGRRGADRCQYSKRSGELEDAPSRDRWGFQSTHFISRVRNNFAALPTACGTAVGSYPAAKGDSFTG